MRNLADFESIHRLSSRNRGLLARSDRTACFYWQAVFGPSEVMHLVDGAQLKTGDTAHGITALCPRCGIDAVLPSVAVSLRMICSPG